MNNRESYRDLLYGEIHRNPAVINRHQNAFNTSEIREIPSLSLLNFWKDYSIRISSGEINNNPCKLMRRGLYRNAYTKYLRHWVIWERKYLHKFVQKVEKKLLQLWMQHKCSLSLSEDNFDLWRSVSRLSRFALMLNNVSLFFAALYFLGPATCGFLLSLFWPKLLLSWLSFSL